MAVAGGFGSIGKMASAYGYGPTDLAKGLSNCDASKAMGGRNPSGQSYGGFGAVGGPVGGARAVDAAYGRNMEGYAGLGIGNPSSYGGVTAPAVEVAEGPVEVATEDMPEIKTAVRPDSADNHNSPGNRAFSFPAP